jgi:hypothetical protein
LKFERQILKPGFSFDMLQVMGLKGYRLWVMGQLDSNVQSPTTTALLLRQLGFTHGPKVLGVAVQVELNKARFKTMEGKQLIGSVVETRRFQAMTVGIDQMNLTCLGFRV